MNNVINLPICGIVIETKDGGGSIYIENEDEFSGEYKVAIRAILSLILGHACAGIDTEEPAYLEGIETAMDSIANEYGE